MLIIPDEAFGALPKVIAGWRSLAEARIVVRKEAVFAKQIVAYQFWILTCTRLLI